MTWVERVHVVMAAGVFWGLYVAGERLIERRHRG